MPRFRSKIRSCRKSVSVQSRKLYRWFNQKTPIEKIFLVGLGIGSVVYIHQPSRKVILLATKKGLKWLQSISEKKVQALQNKPATNSPSISEVGVLLVGVVTITAVIIVTLCSSSEPDSQSYITLSIPIDSELRGVEGPMVDEALEKSQKIVTRLLRRATRSQKAINEDLPFVPLVPVAIPFLAKAGWVGFKVTMVF